MADIAHDAGDDGFHEIQLSGKQLVFLFMATTVVSVVIFLCGVLVGRGVRADRGGLQTTAQQTLASTPAAPDQPVPQTAHPGAPADAPRPTSDALTYPDRLASEGTSAEKLRPVPQEKPKPSSPPTPAVDAAAKAPPEPAKPASEKEAPAPVATHGGGARPGVWVVQAVALRDRSAAMALANRLSAKGYPAFVVSPSAGSPAQVYRVQVGRYDDRREAEKISDRLKAEEKFNPWISR